MVWRFVLSPWHHCDVPRKNGYICQMRMAIDWDQISWCQFPPLSWWQFPMPWTAKLCIITDNISRDIFWDGKTHFVGLCWKSAFKCCAFYCVLEPWDMNMNIHPFHIIHKLCLLFDCHILYCQKMWCFCWIYISDHQYIGPAAINIYRMII